MRYPISQIFLEFLQKSELFQVNGTPIALEGDEGAAIKECLLRGTIPNQDLLNHLLQKVRVLVISRHF